MKELVCPNCGKAFTVDEADYASIVNQVKNTEFHLHTDSKGVLNFKYIIDKFPKSEKSKPKKHFVLSARKVILNNVRYHQELDYRPFSKDGTLAVTGVQKQVKPGSEVC